MQFEVSNSKKEKLLYTAVKKCIYILKNTILQNTLKN